MQRTPAGPHPAKQRPSRDDKQPQPDCQPAQPAQDFTCQPDQGQPGLVAQLESHLCILRFLIFVEGAVEIGGAGRLGHLHAACPAQLNVHIVICARRMRLRGKWKSIETGLLNLSQGQLGCCQIVCFLWASAQVQHQAAALRRVQRRSRGQVDAHGLHTIIAGHEGLSR